MMVEIIPPKAPVISISIFLCVYPVVLIFPQYWPFSCSSAIEQEQNFIIRQYNIAKIEAISIQNNRKFL